jgi:Na+/pantothenate symporter
MPIIKFTATTVWKAFIMNSLVTTIAVVAAIIIRDLFVKHKDEKGKEVRQKMSGKVIGITFAITFGASLLAYTLLYFLFGFGQSLVVTHI